MFRYATLLLLFCVVVARSDRQLEEYEERLRRIMNEDVEDEKRHERSVDESDEPEQYKGSGDDDDGPGDLTPGNLAPTVIFAIVICSIAGLGVVVFFTSCIYYKLKSRRGSHTFVHMYDDNEDRLLYMVEYEDVGGHNKGQINVEITHHELPTSNIETPSKNDYKE